MKVRNSEGYMDLVPHKAVDQHIIICHFQKNK